MNLRKMTLAGQLLATIGWLVLHATTTAADPASVAHVDWGVLPPGDFAERGRVIESDGLRYIYYGQKQHIYVRVGRLVAGNWEYGDPKRIIEAGVPRVSAPYDGRHCTAPCVIEGRFKHSLGARNTRVFKYLMSYDGNGNGKYQNLFAVSNSLTGPWIKAGPLLTRTLPAGTSAIDVCMVSKDRRGMVFLFYGEVDGQHNRRVFRQASMSNLASVGLFPVKYVHQKGFKAVDGREDPGSPFGDFALDPSDKNFLIARGISPEPTALPKGLNKHIGIAGMATDLMGEEDAVWKPQLTLDALGQPAEWIGHCGFVRDSYGRAILGDDGQIEIIASFQHDNFGKPDRLSSELHFFRVPFDQIQLD